MNSFFPYLQLRASEKKICSILDNLIFYIYGHETPRFAAGVLPSTTFVTKRVLRVSPQ